MQRSLPRDADRNRRTPLIDFRQIANAVVEIEKERGDERTEIAKATLRPLALGIGARTLLFRLLGFLLGAGLLNCRLIPRALCRI